MKRISIYLVLLFVVFAGIFSSCQKEAMYTEIKVDTTFQKVYIENFTASKSNGCATTNEILERMKSVYGDKLVIVSFYAGVDAEPDVNQGFADYRTDFGNYLYEKQGITSTPTLYINGEKVDNDFEGMVAKAVNNIIPVNINMSKCEFNEATGEISINGSVVSKYETSNKLRIQAGIVENGLVSSQIVDNVIVSDYVHNNVFRGTLISIDDNNALVDGKASFNQTIALDTNIDVQNSKVTIYIVEVVNGGQDKIIQAIEQDITIKADDEPTLNFKKKVLLEEHTGPKCPNCKDGADKAEELLSKYGDRLSMVAIHAGLFAKPNKTGNFTLDLRSDVGDIYYSTFKISAQPIGIINRKLWEGNEYTCDLNSWDNRVQESLDEELQAGIVLKSEYNETTRQLSANVAVYPQVKLNGSYKITLLITESGIVGQQQNGSEVINPYTFKHVLRGSMNGAWGSDIINGTAEIGLPIRKNFKMTLNETWVPENCHVIAVLTKAIAGRVAPEVIQIEEIKLK